MLHHHAEPRQPLGPRGAHIVGRQGIHHAATGQPHQRRHGGKRQHKAGQHIAIPGFHPGNRQQLPLHPQPDHQQQPEPEARHRLAEHRNHHNAPVQHPAFIHRRHNPQRQRQAQRNHQTGQPQGQRHRQPAADQLTHRGVVEVGPAQIPAGDIGHPADKLHRQRPIQPIGLADCVHILLRRLRPGHRHRNVTRKPRQRKADGQHGEHHQHSQQRATGEKFQHRESLCAAARCCNAALRGRARGAIVAEQQRFYEIGRLLRFDACSYS